MFASNVTHISRGVTCFLVALTTLLTSLLSASSTSVRAAPAFLTLVGGPITSDTTWTDTYYIVTSNVQVMPGVTLTIEPSVQVWFDPGTLLRVDGTLVARGTVDTTPITFTRYPGYPRSWVWKNIEFTDSSVDATFDAAGNYTGGSILEYCIVEYAGGGVEAAIQIDQASPLIDHCTVRNNYGGGIWAVGTRDSQIVIRNNVISGNSAGRGGGIDATYSTVISNTVSGNSAPGQNGGGIYAAHSTVRDNTVSGNSATCGGGIYATASIVTDNIVSGNSVIGDSNVDAFGGGIYASNSTVTGNTVRDNSVVNSSIGDFRYGGGIYAEGSSVVGNRVGSNQAPNGGGIYADSSTVAGNVISGNSAWHGGGIDAAYSTMISNTVSSNSAVGVGGGIHAAHSTVASNVISGNSAGGGWSEDGGGGGIYADGSTVISNTVSGNSAAGGMHYGKGGYLGIRGGGIYAKGSTVTGNTVSYNSVLNNGGGFSWGTFGWGGGGIYADGGTVTSNTVSGNSAAGGWGTEGGGVAIQSTPQFHHNNLYGNTNYDVAVHSSEDISGTHNYWGTVATVDIQAHILDGYDDYSGRGKLFYVPYLEDPDPDAPVPPPQNLRTDFTGGPIGLSWDAIPSTTTGYGYKVYYDTDRSGPPYQGAGAAEGNSPIDMGNATHFTLSGLGSGIYIAVTAYDTQGRESWYSNETMNLWRAYLPAVLKR